MDADLANAIATLPWFTEGSKLPRQSDWSIFKELSHIASRDLELANEIAESPWFEEGPIAPRWDSLRAIGNLMALPPAFARTIVRHPWLSSLEGPAQRDLAYFASSFLDDVGLELAKRVFGFSWVADGLSNDEYQALLALSSIARTDKELVHPVAGYPWVIDGMNELELQTLRAIRSFAREGLESVESQANLHWLQDDVTNAEYMRFVLGLPDGTVDLTANLSDSLIGAVLDSLYATAGRRKCVSSLRTLGAEPSIMDGLDRDEAFMVIAMAIAVEDHVECDVRAVYQSLLESRFIQAATVSLPLAGDVNIWVLADQPFNPGEDYPSLIGDAARVMEEFLNAPFPTNDVVMLAVASGGNQRQVYFFVGSSRNEWTIYHEMAHYYFTGPPAWVSEGAAEFMAGLVYDRRGVQDLSGSGENAALNAEWCLDEMKFENIRHYAFMFDKRRELGIIVPRPCLYRLGRNFMHAVLDTIGEEAMSAALREYLLERSDSSDENEEILYRALLDHAPSDRKDAFQEIYRALHGGPYVFPEPPASDDHGNEANDATPIAVSEVADGELDYMFDFDYFSFKAQLGQRYRIIVKHRALRATSLGLYEPNGVRALNDYWEYRQRAVDGPEIVWVAPTSEVYYFAVRNFGGETGPYTLTITPIDH